MNLRHALALYVFICIALCNVLHAQNVDIPDHNLRRVIKEALNLAGDVPITRADMRRLTRFEVRGQQIEDLSGLEHAVNITLIDLGENNIRDLSPLAALTRLEYAELRKTPISDLSPLANLVQLHTLFAWSCQISDISPLANLTQLIHLDLSINRIDDIGPLANLTRLSELSLTKNKIVDVSPLANLTQLTYLALSHNWIGDIGPLANLTQLTHLNLSMNTIVDIRPLANLTRLSELVINENKIVNVAPLSGLTNLEVLYIDDNRIGDHSPLDVLPLVKFEYDQVCEMPPLPLADRIGNRTYPSIYSFWGQIVNRPDLSPNENLAMHDLTCCTEHQLRYTATPDGMKMSGRLDAAIRQRDEWIALNPSMIFIVDIRMRDTWTWQFSDQYPQDSPYWIRDAQGEVVMVADKLALLDFTHPEVQDIIVEHAIAVSKCGLFDGVFFDWWHDGGTVLAGYRTNEAEQRARDNIIRRIRAQTRPDFLMMGNTNDRIIPRTGQYFNGSYMENGGSSPNGRYALEWLEHNLRSPQINALQGNSLLAEPPDSPRNLQRMRLATTLSLTHSNGYVVFVIGSGDDRYWYDFWDADLGHPVGEKSQLYDDDIPGLYSREFTNGWAVYNESGAPQIITLPEEVQGVANGLVNTEHALPNLDGEMYLRIKPKNPADVNGDSVVNILDLTIVAQAFGTDNLKADVNGDGVVNVFDLVFVANRF